LELKKVHVSHDQAAAGKWDIFLLLGTSLVTVLAPVTVVVAVAVAVVLALALALAAGEAEREREEDDDDIVPVVDERDDDG
jgi:hypothetical protein